MYGSRNKETHAVFKEKFRYTVLSGNEEVMGEVHRVELVMGESGYQKDFRCTDMVQGVQRRKVRPVASDGCIMAPIWS